MVMSATVSDPRGLMGLKFKCPRCGGYRFGTSMAGDWNVAMGHCNTGTCGYTWKRSEDDKLGVFVPKEAK
jgi:hypothetical protein